MREIRLYGSEGGGAGRSPYPYQNAFKGWRAEGLDSRFRGNDCMPLQLLDNAQVLSYLSTNNWFRISFVIGHFSDRGCSR